MVLRSSFLPGMNNIELSCRLQVFSWFDSPGLRRGFREVSCFTHHSRFLQSKIILFGLLEFSISMSSSHLRFHLECPLIFSFTAMPFLA
ncbi:hypothetical protein L6452_40499 [Arctium lappa]|uniref:Uncharacterized protein n=1 Tax=Arctium lappa TaxID=4217 RepID=A0ACB8XLG6_ARCLA|nr:hypothetical protein L6452_40499 [Arctium lappa]